MSIQTISYRSLDAVEMTGEDLSLILIPGLGGKISSIRWKGQEILAQNPSRPLQLARYAAPYSDFDASGFDECFPTIAPSRYPEAPLEGEALPDHGEVWSVPWSSQIDAGSVHLAVNPIKMPCLFEKWIDVPAAGVIRFHYALTNLSPNPIKYIWSAHPLFAPTPGMRIALPPGTSVLVDWSKDDRLGTIFQEHPWPETLDCTGNQVDLSLIGTASAGYVDKLYTSRLTEGWCLLYDPQSGRYAAFIFPVEKVPFVGLSINMGGWPVDGPGYYNVGLEPCSGYPDSLELAVLRGVYTLVEPHAANQWEMQLHLGETSSQAGAIARISSLAGEISMKTTQREDQAHD